MPKAIKYLEKRETPNIGLWYARGLTDKARGKDYGQNPLLRYATMEQESAYKQGYFEEKAS